MSVYVGFKLGKVHEEHTRSEYYCGGCGWPVTDHDSYCPECGGAFRECDATEFMCEDVSTTHGIFICSKCECRVEECGIDNGLINYCPDFGAEVKRW